ncbi:hypothetical protein AMTR_s00039p00128480 [Amborella trichopoda]|uniref:Uncharacterized protein n=1 Tax=Amborella trichopoda TaxID=13333 RepID=U5D0M2_AMBTC|nr:hypothetical protein AMTR_s00039p00128480 [Amborella trichopoda]
MSFLQFGQKRIGIHRSGNRRMNLSGHSSSGKLGMRENRARPCPALFGLALVMFGAGLWPSKPEPMLAHGARAKPSAIPSGLETQLGFANFFLEYAKLTMIYTGKITLDSVEISTRLDSPENSFDDEPLYPFT